MYRVTVTHPTGFHKGTHELTVSENFGGKTRYVTGVSFGCSRDYPVKSDVTAIRKFLEEHGTTAKTITKLG